MPPQSQIDTAATPAAKIDRLLRRAEVVHLTGKSKTSIYREMQQGTFPLPVRIGTKSVAWRESAIAQWVASRESASPRGAA